MSGGPFSTRSRSIRTAGSRTGRAARASPGRRSGRGRPRARASVSRDELAERTEPPQPLGPRDGRVRRRGRGEDVEERLPQPPLLQAVLGALAEGAPVGLLADEADRVRTQVEGDLLEPLRRAGEVARPEVRRPRRRPGGRVRDPDAVPERLELLGRVELPRREPGRVQQPPEVVARVGEVRRGRRRDTARVDPAEDDRQVRREDVRDGACRYAASLAGSSPSNAVAPSSKSLTSCSPSRPPIGFAGSESRITETVDSRSP
jgi:hypothetical protein